MSNDVSDLIKNLREEDIVRDKKKAFSITKQLDEALKVIQPDDEKHLTTSQSLASNIIISAIYTAHMVCLKQYKIDDVLSAIADVEIKLSSASRYVINKRVHVPLVGIMAGDTLLPITFHSQTEAKQYINTISKTIANVTHELKVVSVELNISVVDAMPEAPDAGYTALTIEPNKSSKKRRRVKK